MEAAGIIKLKPENSITPVTVKTESLPDSKVGDVDMRHPPHLSMRRMSKNLWLSLTSHAIIPRFTITTIQHPLVIQ